jgi:hypothetical protein
MNMNSLPIGATLGEASITKIRGIWDRIKGFDKLFTDDVRWDEEWFMRRIYAPDTVFFEVDSGIMLLTDLKEGLMASAHITFWDCKLSPRTQLIKDCLFWCFMRYDLHRIEIVIPEFSRALRRFVEEKLGFTREGRLRSRMWYMGNLCDALIYSLLREEAI